MGLKFCHEKKNNDKTKDTIEYIIWTIIRDSHSNS